MGFGGPWGANGEASDRRSTCTVGTGVSGRRHWAGFGWVGVGEAGGGGVIGHLPTLLWNEKHLGWAPWEVRGVQKKRMVLLVERHNTQGGGLCRPPLGHEVQPTSLSPPLCRSAEIHVPLVGRGSTRRGWRSAADLRGEDAKGGQELHLVRRLMAPIKTEGLTSPYSCLVMGERRTQRGAITTG
ncbi:hypothetical protein B296_00051635 [Ensete ventricosum]|uniref:Uncharacterized protein n=1 Tax=Ensete ventricosum TaxID=4639 RepID=A0A426X8B6_ENSVE|nr:hypothetical protein B296_00051635 [Ensete ventricosum]